MGLPDCHAPRNAFTRAHCRHAVSMKSGSLGSAARDEMGALLSSGARVALPGCSRCGESTCGGLTAVVVHGVASVAAVTAMPVKEATASPVAAHFAPGPDLRGKKIDHKWVGRSDCISS